MRTIINLIRWLYHFIMLFFMMAIQIGVAITGIWLLVLVGCALIGIDTDWMGTVGIVVLCIGIAVAGILAFLTAGNEDAEQAYLDGVHENHEKVMKETREENEMMTNRALKDYHRSKGRIFW